MVARAHGGARQSLLIAAIASLAMVSSASAQADLSASTQNPISSMISVPFENTFDFGAPNGNAWVMNVQPVIPVTVGNWNLVNRIIAPVADVPGGIVLPSDPFPVGGGRVFGLGDINYSLFASPANPGPVIWGVGPSMTFPSATDPRLGAGKFSIGPTAVILTQPKPWSIGVLFRQLWSVGGEGSRADISQLAVQPFINYNLANGWYLFTDPTVVANWKAKGSQRWTVPVGAGAGRIFNVGSQPVNVRAGAFYNLQKPDGAPDWAAKFTVQLLFPKK